MSKIEQLRALLEKMHEPAWEALMTSGQPHVCYITDSNDVGTVCCADTHETAQLIALMKNTLPALLAAYGLLHDAHGLFGWLLDEFLLDYNGEPYEDEDEMASRVKGICMAIRDLKEALK